MMQNDQLINDFIVKLEREEATDDIYTNQDARCLNFSLKKKHLTKLDRFFYTMQNNQLIDNNSTQTIQRNKKKMMKENTKQIQD